jgi:hypothetical protein
VGTNDFCERNHLAFPCQKLVVIEFRPLVVVKDESRFYAMKRAMAKKSTKTITELVKDQRLCFDLR